MASTKTNKADAKKKRQQEIKEITEQLEDQLLGNLFDSEKYKKFLMTMGKFWRYSLNNQILIYRQFPMATYVASYRNWQTKFHRHVRQGEKGIKVLVPIKVKKKQNEDDEQKDDNDEEEKSRAAFFKVCHVWDISQTEGEPLPTVGVDELCGDVHGYDKMEKAISSISPVPIRMAEIYDGSKGYYDRIKKEIVIKKGMSQSHTIHTLLHEITHAILAQKKIDEKMDRATNEVIAESVSYTVCCNLGIDTSGYSCGYIVSWSDGRDLRVLKQSLQLIRDTAFEIMVSLKK